MPGYNAQTYKDYFIHKWTEARARAQSEAALGDSDILRMVDDGIRRISRTLKMSETRTRSNLTDGTATYTIPSGVMSRGIKGVRILPDTGEAAKRLTRLDFNEAADIYDIDDTSDDSGSPKHYWFDPENPRQIVIRPVPENTVTNGLMIFHERTNTPLTRIVQGSANTAAATYTAAFTNASATVTTSSDINSAVGSGSIQVGDEIAPVFTTQQDATTITGDVGRGWYRISAVSTTTITLDTEYVGIGGAALDFIVAQVPEIEKEWPGQFGFLPVDLALEAWLTGIKPDLARAIGERANSQLQAIEKHERDGLPMLMPSAGAFGVSPLGGNAQ